MLNALTVDVEDYFQVAAFEKVIDPHDWDTYPLRVGDNTRRVLELFARHDVKGTFFILGWVAERLPDLVRQIVAEGHEVASHGYGHQRIMRDSKDAFREDVKRSKAVLEDITGEAVKGYRAPTYSITKETLWALEVLVEEGFKYDSSIFPIHHDLYGIPGYERFPHTIDTPAGEIGEFPITTAKVKLGWRQLTLPVAGGGYLRLLPVRWIERALRSVNEEEKRPVVLYFHPWELDPEQPRINAPIRSRIRHYINLRTTEQKLDSLLLRFSFAPFERVLNLSEG
ncbi:MAG: polysaccharide deacetylase family protein [Deltaproteobacteria bacterium]|nr:MAG: polysaccharide deacetylase family protein [Deltaproteobacteria bacterium]